jgi:manganese/iron transport system permease protein
MTEFLQSLLTPFHYDYMLNALGVSALIGGVCGFLSAFITLKGWSLMGDALSHAVVAAGTMAFIKAQSRIREDATIGIVFTTYFALGLVLITLFPARVDLKTIILGNILGISGPDILQVIVISAVTLLILGLKWKDLMLFCFDPNQARAIGLPTTLLHLTLLTLLAATSVAALQAVGACLVVAMLVTPGATAYLLTDRFGKMVLISSGLGAGTSLAGAYASYYLNGATGGCIVTLQTLVFLAVFLFAPKHGMVAARR